MAKFLIRNDDVSADTTLQEIKTFCEICDKYNFPIMHAITLIGECRKVKTRRWDNEKIKSLSDKKFSDNHDVINYLKNRNDLIAVHGLYHSHIPSLREIKIAKEILVSLGFRPTHFVPPFNEGDFEESVLDLKVSILSEKNGERLESFLSDGTPNKQIMYLHSWRFDNKWFKFDDLEKCLARLSKSIKLNLGCKWRKLKGFDNLDKIFGWYFQDGLPMYKDNSVDGITISHALMFLTPQELNEFTKEMHRVLKPGGVIRVTEDDTENPKSEWYLTGNLKSGPKNLTGPGIYRKLFESNGFEVYDVDRKTTFFEDDSLMQSYRGGGPNVFFLEVKKKINNSQIVYRAPITT